MSNGNDPDGTELDDAGERSGDGGTPATDDPDDPEAPSAATEEPEAEQTEGDGESGDANEQTGPMEFVGGADDGEANPTEDRADAEEPGAPEPGEGEHEIMQRRLEERELGLDTRAEDLDERETALDAREADLDEREAELSMEREELEDWKASLNHRDETLDEREAELEAYEDELEEWSDQLAADEETIQHYVADQVDDLEATISDTITMAMDDYEEARQPGRFGRTGDLVAAIVGLVVTSGGVGYGTWVTVAPDGGFFASMFSEYIFAIALVIIGLVITLVIVIDRF